MPAINAESGEDGLNLAVLRYLLGFGMLHLYPKRWSPTRNDLGRSGTISVDLERFRRIGDDVRGFEAPPASPRRIAEMRSDPGSSETFSGDMARYGWI
jgi:hypothetical protein